MKWSNTEWMSKLDTLIDESRQDTSYTGIMVTACLMSIQACIMSLELDGDPRPLMSLFDSGTAISAMVVEEMRRLNGSTPN